MTFFLPSNSLIGRNLQLGDLVRITLVNPMPFVVDTKRPGRPEFNLHGQPTLRFWMPGQTLAVHCSLVHTGLGCYLGSCQC